jgi:hypothetical protein
MKGNDMRIILFVGYYFFAMNICLLGLSLDSLGIKYCTDKSSLHHNYTALYGHYFEPLRDANVKFLEIGFCQGASAYMWEEYFKNGNFYFIDIDKTSFVRYGNRLQKSKFFIGDQSNRAVLGKFVEFAGSNFDIIIDDGGHTMEQQITSFQELFPHVKSGGIYIIEDLHTSYWSEFLGKYPKTTVSFLQSLIDDVNYIGAATGCANKEKCPKDLMKTLNLYQKSIKSLHFYDSICFIFKN